VDVRTIHRPDINEQSLVGRPAAKDKTREVEIRNDIRNNTGETSSLLRRGDRSFVDAWKEKPSRPPRLP
jgi:hypothetical protein